MGAIAVCFRLRFSQRSDGWHKALAPAARICCAAAAILPAVAMVWRIAPSADDDVLSEPVAANAAAGVFQKLRLIARHKLDPGSDRQVELIRDRTDAFHVLFEFAARGESHDLADDEPARAEADRQVSRRPARFRRTELLDCQPHAIGEPVPSLIATVRPNVPAAAKSFALQFDRGQAVARRR